MSSHKVPVIKIEEILPHPNADRLEIIPIGGFQVVSGKGQFKVGDLAIYVPPDSVVPEKPEFSFVWEKDGGGNPRDFAPGESVPDKYRRVTVRRLRKEWSEGLLMPISIAQDVPSGKFLQEGDDCAERLGIEHWNPPEDQEDSNPSRKQSKTRPRSLKGWIYFLKNWAIRIITLGQYDPWGNCGGTNEKAPRNTPPIYDVENFKNYKDVFIPGEEVVVTEKIHGSNGRFLYQPDLLGGGKMYAGSRQLWKKTGSTNVWRKILEYNPEITEWCKAHPNYVLYGEAVPTQGAGFDYGATKDKPDLHVFDIRTPEGEWLDYDKARGMTAGYSIQWAPLLYHGPYDFEKISSLVDGKTKTAGNHIREGIVVKTYPERHQRGLGRAQLKIVSNKYLEKEQ
jgi:RNA ligase